jgi:GxxExxY protein
METQPSKLDVLPELSRKVIGCAMRVHSALGPGLLESIYEACLTMELEISGIEARRQVIVPVRYRDRSLDCHLRIDLLVQEQIVVEVKAVEELLPVHEAQLMTYLKLTGRPLGLLLNFNVPHLREGIRRRANTRLR